MICLVIIYCFNMQNMDDVITCPITSQIYFDPVMTSDGHTYEKNAIIIWFSNHDTSPMTNIKLKNKTLIENISMKQLVNKLIYMYPEKIHKKYINNDTEEEKKLIQKYKKEIESEEILLNIIRDEYENIKVLNTREYNMFDRYGSDNEEEHNNDDVVIEKYINLMIKFFDMSIWEKICVVFTIYTYVLYYFFIKN
jgi:hypothetical protein